MLTTESVQSLLSFRCHGENYACHGSAAAGTHVGALRELLPLLPRGDDPRGLLRQNQLVHVLHVLLFRSCGVSAVQEGVVSDAARWGDVQG